MLCHICRFSASSWWRFQASSWQRCFATSADLTKWQRRCDRLMGLQGRIRYPPFKSVSFGDKTYQLPLKSVDPPNQPPSQEELEYLRGFFDGDGCVTMIRQTGQISLKIGQNVDSAEVLLYFRDRLGGGVGVQRARTGKHKAYLCWHITGSNMRHAAALLGQVPSMKQAQLLIGAIRSKAATHRTAEMAENLRKLKQKDHRPNRLQCTWAYLSGFFDAEGSVTVTTRGSLVLELCQVNPFVLEHLLALLHQNGLEKWHLYKCQRSYKLCCSDTATSKRTLACLLKNGLLVKKKQAELALSIRQENARGLRGAIMGLNGWQSRYARLSEEDVDRANEISALQTQSRTTSCPDKRELLREKIEDLQAEHAFQKLVSRCRLLRKDIRNSLSEGAYVTPS